MSRTIENQRKKLGIFQYYVAVKVRVSTKTLQRI